MAILWISGRYGIGRGEIRQTASMRLAANTISYWCVFKLIMDGEKGIATAFIRLVNLLHCALLEIAAQPIRAGKFVYFFVSGRQGQ